MIQKPSGKGSIKTRLVEIPLVFYKSSAAVEPVLEWLRSLPVEDRRVIGTDLSTVQFGWPIGMPLCRPLGSGLWEVRSNLPSRRISRVLFFADEGRVGVVHGFIKKTQEPSPDSLALARKRIKEMKA